ncbi:MAG: hypothetical protein EB166_04335 [Thaumarchaeota archaeon]|nr:hypothetical protein [Nitrososphaerota archaeon]
MVFDFLSNFENMPKWSTQFVKGIVLADGKKKLVTPFGEAFVRIDSDKNTGVIDIYAGPFFKWPETSDQMWEMFCDWIKIEVGNIKKLFS